MKTIGYIRVSTDDQDYESQITQIRKYAELNKLELIDIIKEKGISGSTSINSRPAGRNIQQHIDAGCRHIIAAKLDRMFRSTVDALSTTDQWTSAGVALHIIDFAGFGSLNTSSPLGRMVFTMQAAFAEMELAQIRGRTKTAMQHKKDKGEFTGQVPFGYRRSGEGGWQIAEEPWRPQAIKRIAQLAAAGRSYRFIAECVTEEFATKCSHTTINRIIKRQDL